MRALAALVLFWALALIYGLAIGPEEGSGGGTAETLMLIGFLLASVAAGALLNLPALIGPPAGVALLIALYASPVELPVFGSSALWGLGAILLACVELFAVAAGIGGRWVALALGRARAGEPDGAYNPAP